MQYGNPFESPSLCYGSVTDYEYQLPIGWSLNGVTSTGSNWIAGDNNEIITSDVSNGVNGVIKIRPANTQCGSGLEPGPATTIAINRPEPAMTITAAQNAICSGNAQYTINGMPPGATVSWSLSSTTDASITGCSTCSSVTLTRNTGANISVVLTATVNYCGFTSTIPYTVVLGLPQVDGGYTAGGNSYLINYATTPPSIPNVICTGQTATTQFTVSPGTTVQWSRVSASPTNTTWSQSGNNISFYFWGAGQSATFKMKATNGCGAVERYYTFQSQDCGGGGGGDCNQFEVSPNPAVNTVTIIVPNIPPPCEPPILEGISSPKTAATNQRTITEVRLYDNTGALKKVKKANKAKQLSMDVSNLKEGIYFIEITGGTYKEKQKLVIQK